MDSEVAPNAAKGAPPAPFQFGLASILVAVALLALFLGLARKAPGLAILFAIVAGPPLMVTIVKSAMRQARGHPMTRTEKADNFFLTLAWTMMILFILGVIVILSIVIWIYLICSGAIR